MRAIIFSLCLVFIASLAFYGCQSVATTSAKLRNLEGNYDLAIQLAKQALEQNPNDAEAYFQLGISYSFLDSVALAYENFTKAKELDPKKTKMVNDNIQHNYAKHYNLGQKAFNREKYETAAREFKLATLADPRQSIGFYNLGVAFSRLGDTDSTYYEKALPPLDKALELSNPSEKHYVDALKSTGRVLSKLGRVEEAVSRFNRLVEEDPTNYAMIEALGVERMNQKDWKGAAVFLDLAARAREKIGAEDFKLYYNLGVANYNMRKENPQGARRAIEYYEKALEVQPDEPQTILNIVITYYSLEEWDKVIAWGEKYVNLVPDGENGWRLLAISYSKIGDQEKARIYSTKYEEIMKMKGRAE